MAMYSVSVLISSCDEPLNIIDTSMHVGDVLTTDGDVLRYHDYEKSGKDLFRTGVAVGVKLPLKY